MITIQDPYPGLKNGVAIYPVNVDQKEMAVQTVDITPSDSEDPQSARDISTPTNTYTEPHSAVPVPDEQQDVADDEKTAISILKVVESYGVNYEKTGEEWKGLSSFIPTVIEQVKNQEAIRMILPAFPFKSPNARDKVLGVLPDLGEELALYHLNGLCDNIARAYAPGADVYISSDGLVYNGENSIPSDKRIIANNHQTFSVSLTKQSGNTAKPFARWLSTRNSTM